MSDGATSASLIERVRAQDSDAWESLCEIYAPLVYSWARKANLKQHDAEDIIQDVFGRVSTGLKNFSHGDANNTFRGWLWTITRNVIRNRFEKLTRDPAKAEGGTHALRRVQDAPDWITNDASDEPQLDSSEESAMLRRALKLVENDFAEHIWNAFWQFTIEGKSARDVAKEVGISEAGVRQAKFRVLARLREVLG